MTASARLALGAAWCAAIVAAVPERALAHPEIAEGDVAIVAIYTGPGPAEVSFHFVLLADFHPDESLGFTDRGWSPTDGFRAGGREGEVRWNAVSPTRAGTVIFQPARDDMDLERRADQVFAYRGEIGADGSFSDLFVYGLNLGGDWTAEATSSTTSALPRGLEDASVTLGASSNCAYAGPTRGSKAELLALIGDAARWTCSETEQPPAPTGFDVIAARGGRCVDDGGCLEGFCVDGVCCDTECRRGETGHCATCDFGPADPRTGTCQPALTACDDGDRCTADGCMADRSCIHAPIEGCCNTHSDCADGDACTFDTCGADARCASEPVAGCAEDASVDGSADAAADADDTAPTPVGSVGGGGCSAGGGAPADWAWTIALIALSWRRRRPFAVLGRPTPS